MFSKIKELQVNQRFLGSSIIRMMRNMDIEFQTPKMTQLQQFILKYGKQYTLDEILDGKTDLEE